MSSSNLVSVLKNWGDQHTINGHCHCNVNFTIISKALPIFAGSIHDRMLGKSHRKQPLLAMQSL